MNEESHLPVGGTHGKSTAETPTELETTVRGILRDAIQKLMNEVEHHEQAAKRHLQQADDLRKELQDSFKIVKQEVRAKTAAAAAATRHEQVDTASAPAEPEPAVPKSGRAEARKRI